MALDLKAWHMKEHAACSMSFPRFLRHCNTLELRELPKLPRVAPFPDWEYVYVLARSLQQPHNAVIEKSRQMLLSWLLSALYLWELVYIPSSTLFMCSRKEVEVDDGGSGSTTKSLFGKIRFMYDRLPWYLKPRMDFKHLLIRNLDNGSVCVGESANVNAGRGGTFRRALLDETAFIPHSESVFAAVSMASPSGVILNSTPNGTSNVFGRIRFSPSSDFQVYTIRWNLRPDRGSDWYDTQVRNLSPLQLAREINISYEESIAGKVYPFKSEQFLDYDIPINPYSQIYTTWDFGVGDYTAVLFLQHFAVPRKSKRDLGFKLQVVDEIEYAGETPDYYADKVDLWAAENKVDFAGHTGDPSGVNRGPSLDSWISWLNERNIKIRYIKGLTFPSRYHATSRIIPSIEVSKQCHRFKEAALNYIFPTDEQGKIKDNKPVHNFASHIMSALEFWAAWKYPIQGKSKVVQSGSRTA